MLSIFEILQQQNTAIKTDLIRFANNPFDPNRNHDLRVAIRSLRSLYKFLKPQLDPVSFKILDENLSNAAKMLNSLRELDVLFGEISDYAFNHPLDTPAYFHLLVQVNAKRLVAMRQVLAEDNWKMLVDHLTVANKQLNQLELSTNFDWSQLIKHEFQRKTKKLVKSYQAVNFSEYQTVHQIRKKAKTLRYASTYLIKFAPKKAKKSHRLAEKVQNRCGAITDAHINTELLQKFIQQTNNQSEKDLLKKILQIQTQVLVQNQ